MKVRAAVLHEMGSPGPYVETMPLRIEMVDLAPPGPDEVLVRIIAAGICHSDLSVIEGVRPRPVPMVVGHECAGVVEHVGAGVSDMIKGDHVIATFVPTCGHCNPCAGGRPALCEPGAVANGQGVLLAGGRRLTQDGSAVNHHNGVSCFADYAVMSRRSLVKVDPSFEFAEAALFGCAVLTGVGTAVNAAAIKPGSTVAIIGLGGVGLAGLIGAKACGAERIVAIDTNPGKFEIARELGATDTFDALDADVVEAIRSATGGGVETVLEFAGATSALELGYAIASRGGELISAGLPRPNATMAVPAVSLVAEEKVVRGSYMGSSVPTRDIPRYLAMYRRGLLPVNRLTTHTMPLEDINAGMDRLKSGEAIRQIIMM